MPRYSVAALLFVCAVVPAEPGFRPSSLALQDRVEAQRLIERIQHSHQTGTTRAFEAAVSSDLTERRTHDILSQSLALERLWGTPVTIEALQREMERIRRDTLFPDRLAEIESALGHDTDLILETFVRASLVDRLTRDFFAFDERIHGPARHQAEMLHKNLVSGALDPRSPHPQRTVVELRRAEEGGDQFSQSIGAPSRLASAGIAVGPTSADERVLLSAADYGARRAIYPAAPGAIGDLEEQRDQFLVRAVLDEDPHAARVATWSVPKRSFEDWWSEVEHDFPAEAIPPTRSGSRSRLTPARRAPPRGTREVEEPPADLPRDPLCGRDDTWDTTPFDAHPHNMSGHTAVWTGEEMIVWGGRDIGGYRYDPLIDHWTPMSVAGAPGPGPLVWTGEEVIVWDGENGGRYDPALDAWTPVSNARAPSPRMGHSAVWTGEEMIVWGGYYKDPLTSLQTDFRSGGRYDPASDTWSPMTTVQAPSARSSHTAVWTGAVMVVLGPDTAQGGRYDPLTDTWLPTTTVGAAGARSAVWTGAEVILMSQEYSWFSGYFAVWRRYDPVRDTYATLPRPPLEFPFTGTPVWSGSEIIIWDASRRVGARYDPTTNSWKRISSLNAPWPRSSHSILWAGDRLVLWGGGSRGVGTGARYDPLTDTWTPTATPAGPSDDAGPEAVWTGNEMIVWHPNATGAARFDPLTSRWKSITPVGAPGSGNAVWTGQEMVVFGGFSKRTESGHSKLAVEGGRYDPIADLWTSMALPPKAWKFPIVWTGTALIAWGGRTSSPESDNDHVTSAGARYDLQRDSWTPMSLQGAPTQREDHVAVWTGREMIVWGGDEPECYDRTGTFWPDCDHPGGGRYDPLTDTWKPMSPDGPDTAHSGVWTGREMILWDGRQSRAYDPSADRWRSLPIGNAPPGRYDASVTMAGESLIVWGGQDGSLTNEGARYDTISDSWAPMSVVGAPSPRAGHTAVWTGQALIVWGGVVNAPAQVRTGTGGIYFLAPDLDNDGFASCAGDCDDDNPLLHPAAVDLPGNTRDEDCDGVVACDPGDYPRQRGAFVQCVAQECRRLVEAGRVEPNECRSASHQGMGGPECGDGVASSREACDGDALRDATCLSLGFDGGALGCNETCDGFDVAGCSTVCGDGRRAGNETCDRNDLSGATCVTAGFDAGTLACDSSCGGFDVTGCTTVCGDGRARGTEVCDEEDFGGRTCATLGFDDGTPVCGPGCDAIDVSGCTTVCGDGSRRGYEPCDGADLGGRTCVSLGYEGGSLSCDPSCAFVDESDCETCGDGIGQGDEVCDEADLRGGTCQSEGLESGQLRCNYECNGFEFYWCTGCGNGVREGDELCDGYDTGGNLCTMFGLEGYGVGCNETCDALDFSPCSLCGDGVAGRWEACDGADLAGQTCQSAGFDEGTLACKGDCKSLDTAGCTSVCGDGVRRGAEQCDGQDLARKSCRSLSYDGGTLGCTASCTFDTSVCHRCGNGIIEPGEGCERYDLGGATCESLGFESGTLGCWSNCQLRTRECVGGCGNEEVDDGEICDGPPRASCQDLGFDEGWGPECKPTCDGFDVSNCWKCGDGVRHDEEACDSEDLRGYTCGALGFDGGTLGCSSDCSDLDTIGCTTVCGDGVRRGREKCDGDDISHRCSYLGFDSGSVSCNATCDGFDTSGCYDCGDGVKNPTEVCDRSDLDGETCESFGFSGGTLRCGEWCNRFDITGCVGCGNDVREGSEACDGEDLTGATCQSRGFKGGTLSCRSLCDGFDVSRCTGCGDGFRSTDETCDSGDLAGMTCESFGFLGGTLSCAADCKGFDVTACETVCGDGVVGGAEVCDSRNFGHLTCDDFGSPGGGSLSCNETCDAIDASHCVPCGDGIVQGAEQCDSGNLRGFSCSDWGFPQGTLRCSAQCRFDTSSCYGGGTPPPYPPPQICGDHRRSGTEFCDGPDVRGQSCIGLGFDGGYLLCNATCDALDLTTCSKCGDNVRTHNERCDGADLGGETCQTLGFASGTLACTADCSGLDKTGCH